jgi:predicted amidophosphoribosyltransferase
LFIVIAIVASILTPTYKSVNCMCGQCGNFVSNTSQQCPHCHIKLVGEKPWVWFWQK